MSSNENLVENAANLATQAELLAEQAASIAVQATETVQMSAAGGGVPFFIVGLTVLVLSCFVGYFVVWRVTPALHSPLMAVTNAISSVIIVGALIAASAAASGWGYLAVILASINIFGGFIVTQRMLHMFSKKKKK